MRATESHKAVMRRYWRRRCDVCRSAGLCVTCRRNPVVHGDQTCEPCRETRRMRRKLREIARG